MGKRITSALCAVVFDFDGTLCDMSAFEEELRGGGPDRWSRFFAHTPEAVPVPAGVELVARLDGLGWRYGVSSTRPAWPGVGRAVKDWLGTHLSGCRRPAEVWLRKPSYKGAAVTVKRYHCRSDKLATVLFVDDEPAMVDALTAEDVPAMTLEELAGLSDTELAGVLDYSRTRRLKHEKQTQPNLAHVAHVAHPET